MILDQKAQAYAIKAHSGQFRRDKKTPYIEHPKKVVEILSNWGIKDRYVLAAAWLHDVVEDTVFSISEIEGEFGGVVADYVWDITKVKNQDYDKMENDYIEKLRNALPEVKLIKLADIMANLGDMHNIPNLDYKFEKYMAKKMRYLQAISNNWENPSF